MVKFLIMVVILNVGLRMICRGRVGCPLWIKNTKTIVLYLLIVFLLGFFVVFLFLVVFRREYGYGK